MKRTRSSLSGNGKPPRSPKTFAMNRMASNLSMGTIDGLQALITEDESSAGMIPEPLSKRTRSATSSDSRHEFFGRTGSDLTERSLQSGHCPLSRIYCSDILRDTMRAPHHAHRLESVIVSVPGLSRADFFPCSWISWLDWVSRVSSRRNIVQPR